MMILNNFKVLFQTVWRIEKKYFLYVFLNAAGIAIFTYYSIQLPIIVLTMIESQTIDAHQLVFVFGVLFASTIIAAYAKALYMPVGSKVRYHFLLEVSKQYMSIPYETYEDPQIQNDVWKISRPVSSIDGIQGIFADFALFMGNLTVLIIAVGLLFQLEIWLASGIAIWFIVFTYLSMRASNKVDQQFNENIHLSREDWYLNDIAVDVAFGKEIRVFKLQSWLQNKLTALHQKINAVTVLNEKTRVMPLIFDDTIQFIRDALIYLFVIRLYFNGVIGLGALASYSVMIAQLNRGFTMGSDCLQRLLSKHENIKNMFEFIDLPKQSNEGLSIHNQENWVLEFNDVSFKYPNTEHYIYKHLTFTIAARQKLAIVGLNGVGKTTLMKLLLRFYKPTSGDIKLNGINIEAYKLSEYFELFAPVFQEINLFPFTVKENLSFDQDIDETILMDALDMAGLDHCLFNKDMLNTVHLTRYIHSDGLELSGGQAQKFVTARALAFNRPIYIFDEPTSALDAVAEYDFYHHIEQNMKDKTILFVSHRLASTQFCDEILLIEGQTIQEQGSHEALLAKGGRYAELFKMQAKYYQEDL